MRGLKIGPFTAGPAMEPLIWSHPQPEFLARALDDPQSLPPKSWCLLNLFTMAD